MMNKIFKILCVGWAICCVACSVEESNKTQETSRVQDRPDQGRVNRGEGSWTDRSGHLTPKGGHNLRSAARTGDEQNSSDDHMGFRLCIDFLSL
jgi:hypothetical protein